MLQRYLTQNGVALDSVKIVEAPFPQMEGILKGGSADAAMAIEPYLSLSLKNKTIRILGHPYTDFKPQVAVSSYDIRIDWLKENPETAKKFASAIAEATDFIKSNDAEARQILIKYTNAPAEVANDIVIPEFVGKFESQQLQSWIDELLGQKILEKPVTVQDVYQQQ
jgi:NitT/TauT family transport system substrate-binding protein